MGTATSLGRHHFLLDMTPSAPIRHEFRRCDAVASANAHPILHTFSTRKIQALCLEPVSKTGVPVPGTTNTNAKPRFCFWQTKGRLLFRA
jgi:hypothetical protein